MDQMSAGWRIKEPIWSCAVVSQNETDEPGDRNKFAVACKGDAHVLVVPANGPFREGPPSGHIKTLNVAVVRQGKKFPTVAEPGKGPVE